MKKVTKYVKTRADKADKTSQAISCQKHDHTEPSNSKGHWRKEMKIAK